MFCFNLFHGTVADWVLQSLFYCQSNFSLLNQLVNVLQESFLHWKRRKWCPPQLTLSALKAKAASRIWISNLLLISFSFRSASSRRILLLNIIFPGFVPPYSMLILSPYICVNLVSSFCNVEEFSNSSPPISRSSALYCVLRSLERNTSSSSIICISIVTERALKASLWILLEKCYQDSSCPFCCPSPVLMDQFDTSLARFWYSTRQIEW